MLCCKLLQMFDSFEQIFTRFNILWKRKSFRFCKFDLFVLLWSRRKASAESVIFGHDIFRFWALFHQFLNISFNGTLNIHLKKRKNNEQLMIAITRNIMIVKFYFWTFKHLGNLLRNKWPLRFSNEQRLRQVTFNFNGKHFLDHFFTYFILFIVG